MDEQRFIPYLKELAAKYTPAAELSIKLEEGRVQIGGGGRSCRFVFDFARGAWPGGGPELPLFHWRAQRRYIELKNILEQGFVGRPLALRIHHILPPGEFCRSLQDLFTFEADLVEWLTGQRIERVFADFSGGSYTNCILATQGGVRASLELGFSPAGSQPVLLHEIIGKKGVASDLAVDTQTQQYPVYLFRGKETVTYADLDAELYGLESAQADCIRFLLGVLARPEAAGELQADQKHLSAVWRAAVASSENTIYAKVEE